MRDKYKKYTEEERQETVERVCDEIANGAAVTTVLKDNSIVSWSTFQKWLKANPVHKELYQDAQRQRETFLFEQMLAIAFSESPKSIKKYKNGELVETIVKDSVEDRRLKINVIKYTLAKMNPNKFGERVIVEPDTSNPITSIRFLDVDGTID
ncbi:hypothetical protein GKZ90_0021015 [Flavobacterium sp. MC2016-06]|uniref:terminase small subunit-like protein n=1 Tax=Flavobacterium sp. MC2016-06 TaxID=2676308 RepID=UPI0012BAED3F|nr:hypothetical protein [Flavobacterium sp. MC2016-06]MBU3860982.1 hypothetical protein [Flavobacterium sp. MC2016-06]